MTIKTYETKKGTRYLVVLQRNNQHARKLFSTRAEAEAFQNQFRLENPAKKDGITLEDRMRLHELMKKKMSHRKMAEEWGLDRKTIRKEIDRCLPHEYDPIMAHEHAMKIKENQYISLAEKNSSRSDGLSTTELQEIFNMQLEIIHDEIKNIYHKLNKLGA